MKWQPEEPQEKPQERILHLSPALFYRLQFIFDVVVNCIRYLKLIQQALPDPVPSEFFYALPHKSTEIETVKLLMILV